MEPHEHSYVYTPSGEGHVGACGCGDELAEEPHTYKNGICKCGAVEPHVHNHVYTPTASGHKGVCGCGDELAEEPHTYENGVCKCGALEPAEGDEGDFSNRY